ncbi:MAG: GGDEF domain-containing protein [Anaeroplasma sp.]
MKNKEIITISLKKNWREYGWFLLLILALEIFMVAYALKSFDFNEPRRVAYFISYLSLIILTIISLFINYFFMKKQIHKNITYYNVIIYSFVLILWSALISALDIIGGGYAVTYMTILAAVGSLIAFHPLCFSIYTILSSLFMIVIVNIFGDSSLHIPFYLNHFIFLIVAITVEFRNYLSTSKQIAMNVQLEEQANKDGLTKIFNRRYLDDFVFKLLQDKKSFTFVLIDVDNFKSVNDIYGHQEGDESLVNIANILKNYFGENVFRYGGDEFAIISYEDEKIVNEKIDSANQLLLNCKKDYVIQISAGIYHNADNDDERRIFELADEALYKAKQLGKGRSIVSK